MGALFKAANDYIQKSKVCGCVTVWVFSFPHSLCACLDCMCVKILGHNHWTMKQWTHRLSQGCHLTCIVCVCVCALREKGSLMRALIKRQTVYWMDPVVINRAESCQPPALWSLHLLGCHNDITTDALDLLIGQVLIYRFVLTGTISILLQHPGQVTDITSCLISSTSMAVLLKIFFLLHHLLWEPNVYKSTTGPLHPVQV